MDKSGQVFLLILLYINSLLLIVDIFERFFNESFVVLFHVKLSRANNRNEKCIGNYFTALNLQNQFHSPVHISCRLKEITKALLVANSFQHCSCRLKETTAPTAFNTAITKAKRIKRTR